jgi:hypothetical protein
MYSHALVAEDVEVADPLSGKLHNQQEVEVDQIKGTLHVHVRN